MPQKKITTLLITLRYGFGGLITTPGTTFHPIKKPRRYKCIGAKPYNIIRLCELLLLHNCYIHHHVGLWTVAH